MNRHPPRVLLVSWAALMALLGLTVFGAYQPLGVFNTALALAIALGKALIVATIFMELRERSGLTIAFAGAGFFWLAIMLWLGLADFVTRPHVSSDAQHAMSERTVARDAGTRNSLSPADAAEPGGKPTPCIGRRMVA